ncbi:hypothetical protein GD604_06065 [Desulfolutivibrio sulfoxidireducens]|nr:hypothetical protein GD604_06065 [Desulfolutivibrio sulfoxidireducens]
MSSRLYVLALGLLLQAPLALDSIARFRPDARTRGGTPVGAGFAPGAMIIRAGFAGGLCGLVYAVMAHDPVFFLGQAVFLGLFCRPPDLTGRASDGETRAPGARMAHRRLGGGGEDVSSSRL